MTLQFGREFRYTIGNPNKCKHHYHDMNIFWLPIKQAGQDKNEEYLWVDDRSKSKGVAIKELKWAKGEPNGLDIEQCVDLYSGWDQWNDQFCSAMRCSTCNMPIVQTYHLRGPGSFDRVYSLLLNMQSSFTEIVFEGEGTSKVVWYPLEEKTAISNYKTNTTIEFSKDPFGVLQSEEDGSKNKWKFSNVSFIESIVYLYVMASSSYGKSFRGDT